MNAYAKAMVIGAILSGSTAMGMAQRPPQDVDQVAQSLSEQQSNPAVQISTTNVLLQLQTKMIADLQTIESFVAQKRTGEALTLAKATLDEVRSKTGIDTKVKISEKMKIPTVFRRAAARFNQLEETDQQAIMRTFRNYQGELYMDLLNLTKRTTLIYIKAFTAEIERNGGMNEEDRKKILYDLAKATLIPMTVADQKGVEVTVFDDEVSNDDHIYMFNREIKMYILSNKKLALSEAEFTSYREQVRKHLLQNGGNSPIQACFAEAAKEPSHSREMSYDKQSYNRNICFNKYVNSLENFEQCKHYAQSLSWNDYIYSAVNICKAQFKQFKE